MKAAPSAGYSGTPLARKLSLKDGLRTWWEAMPATVRAEIEGEDIALELLPAPAAPIDAAHVFVTTRAALEDAVARLLPLLALPASSGFPGRRKRPGCRPTLPRT